jgi:hypothetical protein
MGRQTGPFHEAAAPEDQLLPAGRQHGHDRTQGQFDQRPLEIRGDGVDRDVLFQRKGLGSPEPSKTAIEAALIKTIQHGQIPFN